VLSGSPAECGGLVEGDRILEVNHSSVDQRHRSTELASLIRLSADQVSLLVIDRDTEALCAHRGVGYVDASHHVKHIMCPHVQPPQTPPPGKYSMLADSVAKYSKQTWLTVNPSQANSSPANSERGSGPLLILGPPHISGTAEDRDLKLCVLIERRLVRQPRLT